MHRKIEVHPLSLLIGAAVALLAVFSVGAAKPSRAFGAEPPLALQVPSKMTINLVLSEGTALPGGSFDVDD